MPEPILISDIEDEPSISYARAQTETEIVVRASLSRRRVIEYAAANGDHVFRVYKQVLRPDADLMGGGDIRFTNRICR